MDAGGPSLEHGGDPTGDRFRTRYGVLAVVWLALIIYGSFLPFRLKAPPWPPSAGPAERVVCFLTAPQWEEDRPAEYSSLGISHELSDQVVNIALYVPLGILLRLAACKRRWPIVAQVGGAIAVAATASWLIECTQSVIDWRNSSINDFLLNTTGAAAGALVATWLRRAGVRLVFHLYCGSAARLHRLRAVVGAVRRKPGMAFAAVLLNLGIVIYACGWAVDQAAARRGPVVNLLPFAQHFRRSWDVAMLQIGDSMALYLLIAALLSLQFFKIRQRWTVLWVAIGAAALAGLREIVLRLSAHTRIDLTEPILALMAVAALMMAGILAARAVRDMCRRRASVPVPVERRRVPYQYRA